MINLNDTILDEFDDYTYDYDLGRLDQEELNQVSIDFDIRDYFEGLTN